MSSPAKKRPKLKAARSAPHPRPPLRLFDEPPPGTFPSTGELLRFFAVVAIAASVAVACHFVAGVLRRQPKPFCESGEEPQDFCEPCPDHGECTRGRWECSRGYRKKGRRCIEDGEINKKVEKLLQLVEDYVCGSYARVLCGGTGTIWFQEADILSMLDEDKLKEMIGSENDIWFLMSQKAIKTAESSLETRPISDGMKELKCPDLLVEHHKPYLCRIQLWMYENAVILVLLSVLIVGSVWLLLRLRRRQYISSRAEQLYEQICEILEETALTSKRLDNGGEPWVGFSWLRDHLLLPGERKDSVLWKKVEELVQEDSRIDQYPKLIKGEPRIVLEWQVEGSLSSKTRSKVAASRTKPSNYIDRVKADTNTQQEINPEASSTT